MRNFPSLHLLARFTYVFCHRLLNSAEIALIRSSGDGGVGGVVVGGTVVGKPVGDTKVGETVVGLVEVGEPVGVTVVG